MGKYLFLPAACLFWCISVAGQPERALQEFVEAAGLRNAAVGVCVKRVADGRVVADYRSQMSLTPASVAKLLPTWFGLQEKGAGYRFRTSVSYTGVIRNGVLTGDLIVRGGGNPCPDSRFFPECAFVKPLAEKLREAGIREVAGRIRVADDCEGTIPGSWPWEDVSNYYAALYFPFNYRDNLYTLTFRTGQVGSRAELLSVVPALPAGEVVSEVKAAAGNRDDAWIYGSPYSPELRVRGTLPAGRAAFAVKGAMHRPAQFFVAELEALLKQQGIAVKGRAMEGGTENSLWTLESPELKEIVYYTNKRSVNLFAEALGKACGGEEWEQRVKDCLQQTGIGAEGVILKDACGLSPMNAVPARVFTDLLVAVAGENREAFVHSLPVGGKDGGLNGYVAAAPALKDKLRAKTGSMSGVRSLSGYLTTRKGEELAFAIIVNHYACSVGELQRAVGQFLTELLDY